ncbi:interleukin-15 receptor subunit alpha isoform X4 [Phyllopteryx taeniolatus]|uniref:interleukin-15 receptor subunit alpha isoform X4 n=1 Tax=Phyllopteryx taeniolatus TaxID=161469 RepID=UPI002AD3C4A1|nr:interleukin-15 receptor subunit alpha isoform X4 [Phyllopteryx taeniolatus]XP_061618180.1 interleukin-15 receptor subunit alpha isoform X4 [Phyllopteryx taeniolatus]
MAEHDQLLSEQVGGSARLWWSCQMALGSRLLDVCVTMACVLGTARCSDGDQSECPCSGIPPWPLTEPPPEDCHQLNRTFRYTCLKGYLRTAGTSNLIKCKPGSSRWSNPTLICKLDPRGVAPHSPNSTDAVEHMMEFESDSPKIGVPSLQQHDETRLETENPAKGASTKTWHAHNRSRQQRLGRQRGSHRNWPHPSQNEEKSGKHQSNADSSRGNTSE